MIKRRIPINKRVNIMLSRKEGQSYKYIADKEGISVSSVFRIVNRWQTSQNIGFVVKRSQTSEKISKLDEEIIIMLISDNSSITLNQIQDALPVSV
jgi:transposase